MKTWMTLCIDFYPDVFGVVNKVDSPTRPALYHSSHTFSKPVVPQLCGELTQTTTSPSPHTFTSTAQDLHELTDLHLTPLIKPRAGTFGLSLLRNRHLHDMRRYTAFSPTGSRNRHSSPQVPTQRITSYTYHTLALSKTADVTVRTRAGILRCSDVIVEPGFSVMC
jgi:hypothetical protein